MQKLQETVKAVFKLHKELHGKNIVDYAVADDVMRKTNREYERNLILKEVQKLMEE